MAVAINEVKLVLTLDEIRSRLANSMHRSITDPVVDTILKISMNQEYGLEALTRSLLNIPRILEHAEDDEVLIPFDYICTWRTSKEEMAQEGLLLKGDLVKAKIIRINEVAEYPYHVEYNYYHSGEKKVVHDTTFLGAKIPIKPDDWPLEL